MDLDDIFIKSYLTEVGEKEKRKIQSSQEDREIAAQKHQQLEVIEKFLQKFVEMEVMVNHHDQYTKNVRSMEGIEPKKFAFSLVDSSKTWAPGVSIWFDNPAQVEIAIPNKPLEEGVVVIRVASHHPDAYILEQRFQTFEAACEALGRFLGRCTTSIGKSPRQYLKEVQQRKQNVNPTQDNSFLQNVPDTLPEDTLVKKSPLIKDGENSLTMKKISDFFSLKNKNLDDEEE
jgi:hypothetical protein